MKDTGVMRKVDGEGNEPTTPGPGLGGGGYVVGLGVCGGKSF